ncbi:urease accessory protein UreH domain-containing protein [Methylolobus aquaticus]
MAIGNARAGVDPPRSPLRFALGLVFAVVGILVILYLDEQLRGHSDLPANSENLSLGLLFVAGLLTGFHCVGMCGALVLGYSARAATAGRLSVWSHLLYGAGKTISYTVIGAGFGLLGSVIAFTPFLRGVVGAVAGLFLVAFGISMLRIWPSFRDFHIKPPAFLLRFIGRESRRSGHPFVIGLLNGLMIICGPLQALYIMAAGTGSPVKGAQLLFVFGAGTLPVMLGFGMLASLLSKRLTPKLLQASGLIVVVLGVIMVNRGLAMTGRGYDFNSVKARSSAYLERQRLDLSGLIGRLTADDENEVPAAPVLPPLIDGFQIVHMAVTDKGFEPNRFRVRKGVPVRWVITATDPVNPCGSAIVIPQFELEIEVKAGEQACEFTPVEEGIIPWSCWMGMMSGTFVVVGEPAGVAVPGGS